MASKMAAKDKKIIVFPIHKYILRIFMSESCFNCNECLFSIYIICNFEIFSTVNSAWHSRWLPKWEILFIGDILQLF